MFKRISISLLILTAIPSFAQQSVQFENKISPNKTYSTKQTAISKTEINIVADQEMMDAFKKQGIKLPIISKSVANSDVVIKTESILENNEIPAQIFYGDMITKTTTDGKTKVDKNPLSGALVLGRYNHEYKLLVDTIIGEMVTEELKNVMVTILKNLQQIVEFPDKPMKTGDSFSVETPLTIPIDDMNPFTMVINTDFLLTKIKGNKAYFDIQQKIVMDISQQDIKLTATGSGDGKTVYDINENYMIKYVSNLTIDMLLDTGSGMIMNTKSISETILNTKIK